MIISLCSGYGGLDRAVAAAFGTASAAATGMAAPFPEWMMGLRPGYVTDLLPRNDALRAIGNGVMPQQGYAAIRTLLAMLA